MLSLKIRADRQTGSPCLIISKLFARYSGHSHATDGTVLLMRETAIFDV